MMHGGGHRGPGGGHRGGGFHGGGFHGGGFHGGRGGYHGGYGYRPHRRPRYTYTGGNIGTQEQENSAIKQFFSNWKDRIKLRKQYRDEGKEIPSSLKDITAIRETISGGFREEICLAAQASANQLYAEKRISLRECKKRKYDAEKKYNRYLLDIGAITEEEYEAEMEMFCNQNDIKYVSEHPNLGRSR